MPRVDFYILGEGQTRERFSCDLAGKIKKQDLEIYIHTSSRNDAEALDDLMWTHRDISFLPHGLVGEQSNMEPITIGWDGGDIEAKPVMINLAREIPAAVEQFQRVLEIVEANDRQEGRRRYKHYRDAGYELHNHDMSTGNELS